jgi:tRNA (cmo5U34)-methyltransferase
MRPCLSPAAGFAVSKQPDRLFAQPLEQVPDFAFNEDVVRVFPDMIKRSVPGYPTIVENLGVLAARFAQPTPRCTTWAPRWAR